MAIAKPALNRSEEAPQVVERILSCRGKVVVLHGPARSGKTDFLRHWVIPSLPADVQVAYADCNPGIPEVFELSGGTTIPESAALSGDAIVFLDGFERFLTTSACKQAASKLLSERRATLVLVTSDEALGDLLSLRSLEPAIMDCLIATGQMSLHEGLQNVAVESDEPRLRYGPELLAAIESDLQTFGPGCRTLTPDLVVLIDAHFRSGSGADSAAVGTGEFEAAGRLRGILLTYLSRRLDQAPSPLLAGDGNLLRGVVDETVACRLYHRDFDSSEPARRLALDTALAASAFTWLREQGILRETRPGQFELAPIHLEQVAAERLERKRHHTGRALEIIAQGMEAWLKQHHTLPPERFREIHDVRSDLRVSDDETAFFVQCALCANALLPGAAQYWLSRLSHREQQIDAAFPGLFDSEPSVRAAAATLLAPFDEPDVRAQLYRTAVEDAEPVVRRAALNSLAGMTRDEFWAPLANDARLHTSRYRLAAVEALRLFPEPRGIDLLKTLVSEPDTPREVRAVAVDTLAAMPCATAAEALVDIALHAAPQEDRSRAAAVLAFVSAAPAPAAAPAGAASPAAAAVEALFRDSIAPARPWKTGDMWWWARAAAAAPGAIAIGLLNVVLHGAALLAVRRFAAGFAILGIELAIVAAVLTHRAPAWVACFLVGTLAAGLWLPARTLISRRARLEFRLASLDGGLLIVFYVQSVFSLFFLIHGLAHSFAGRVSTARTLVALQVFSLGCFGLYLVDRRAFELTHMGRFYFWTAVALWAGTWLWEVTVIARRDIVFPHTGIARRRRYEVYTHLLTNTAAVECIMNYAAGPQPLRRRWAVMVLERNGDRVPPEYWVQVLKTRGSNTPAFVDLALRQARREETVREVQGLWPEACSALRERIFGILARKPNECSLEYLRKLGPQLGFWKRVRHLVAELEFRLKLIPGIVWIAVGLLVPMAGSLAWHGLEYGGQPARLLLDFVNSRTARARDPQRVLRYARLLSEANPREIDPGFSASLGRLANTAARDHRWDIRVPALELLGGLVHHANPRVAEVARTQAESHLSDVSALLTAPAFGPPYDVATRRRLLGVLEQLATPAAVQALKDFVTRSGTAVAPDRVYAGRVPLSEKLQLGEIAALQSEAVRIIAAIGSPEAIQALGELASVPGVAGREAMPSLLLDMVRGAYGRGEYSRAVTQGRQVLPIFEAQADANLRASLLVLLAKATSQLALAAIPDPARAGTLDSEAIAYAEKAAQLRKLDAEARGVLASCYERIAARSLESNDLDGAAANVAKALAADPRSVPALATKAVLLQRREDLAGALAVLGEAARINPRYAWAVAMQASIQLGQKRYPEAASTAAAAINADPEYPWSYALLGQAYHEMGQDRDAAARFEALRHKYPGNPLPVQAEMYVYHEQLSAQDPSAYARNYALYQELRRPVYKPSIAKPDELEAGFIEAQLTTGRFREAAQSSWNLLKAARQRPDANLIVTVRCLLYAALALSHNWKQASAELENLHSALGALPNDYEGAWSYQGSLRFIRSSALPEPLKTAVANLLQAVQDKPAQVPASVFEANREALRSMK